jgi:hypothetical protein
MGRACFENAVFLNVALGAIDASIFLTEYFLARPAARSVRGIPQ